MIIFSLAKISSAIKMLSKISALFIKRKGKEAELLHQLKEQVNQDPGNARAHLKLAEVYQKMGEKRKAISEYLLAAEIFAKNNQYAEAMAIYKQVPKQDPSLDHVYLKIADIYRRMGFLGDAFAQYRILVNHYDKLGLKDKALEVMSLMAELDPRKVAAQEGITNFKEILSKSGGVGGEIKEAGLALKKEKGEKGYFDLRAEIIKEVPVDLGERKEINGLDKVSGFEDILQELQDIKVPSLAYPDFYYYTGLACREMGFLDNAVEYFQKAIVRKEKILASLEMLGLCLKEMGKWAEASKVFEEILQHPEIPPEKKIEIKYELGLSYKELGRKEEAWQLLREISAEDHSFLNRRDRSSGGEINGRLQSLT